VIGKMLAAAAAGVRRSGSADPVLARIGGPIGEEARAAAEELARAGDARRMRAEWCAEARAPVTGGLRGVHPTWIEAAVAELPERARAAVAGDGTAPVDVWLARWACAEFPVMPLGREALPVTIEDVGAIGPPRSVEWLASIGADQLALAVASAGELATAIGRFGEMVARASRRLRIAPRAGNLGPARAAVARCRVDLDDLVLVRIGARALAPHLAGRMLVRRQLVLRMPRPLGVVVERELVAHAHEPLANAPAWGAIIAA
jgi:hypothetical protein